MAGELRSVVEAQQAQLDTLARQQAATAQPQQGWHDQGGSAAASTAAGATGAPAAAAKPHIAQLQRLVQDMRTELRQPPLLAVPADVAAPWADGSSAGGYSPAVQQQHDQQQQEQQQLMALAEKLAGAQERLRQLQAAHDALLAEQARCEWGLLLLGCWLCCGRSPACCCQRPLLCATCHPVCVPSVAVLQVSQRDSAEEAKALQLQLEHACRWGATVHSGCMAVCEAHPSLPAFGLPLPGSA